MTRTALALLMAIGLLLLINGGLCLAMGWSLAGELLVIGCTIFATSLVISAIRNRRQ